MTMREDNQVSLPNAFLQVFPMMFLDVVNGCIHPLCHLVRAFPTGTASPPDAEVSVLLLDLLGRQALVVPIIPFADLLGEVMWWQVLFMFEEEFECFPSAYTRRAVDVADIGWIKKH